MPDHQPSTDQQAPAKNPAAASVSLPKRPISSRSLRVCCYGSSSASTPAAYLKEAHSLGYILATRNHTCVNGAGAAGCMASMNEGAVKGDGNIVGVIHEMFVVDGSDWTTEGNHDNDGNVANPHPVFRKGKTTLIVAGGDDLQERKKLLVQGADAVVVLPGGPGTWDELWEMACAKSIGLTRIPIVCVNVDGYYDPFQAMLQNAYHQKMLRTSPDETVIFVTSAEKAVLYIEEECEMLDGKVLLNGMKKRENKDVKKKSQLMQKRGSMIGPPVSFERRSSFFWFWGGVTSSAETVPLQSSQHESKGETENSEHKLFDRVAGIAPMITLFIAGIAVGMTITTRLSMKS
mmetsp:Transcript_59038/g.70410  ORF Transcript_59038/g.70410 Transcript_59038/m.70410 type:complete len:347 (+) Transcript_59038:106-1146(+)